ncbi:MAG: pyroglutamyl-peptidase I [Anaerolineaceae bacterium]|nr:pyroglutamyl-peptidase I [Anaerolineaceae bacterium]
MMKILLTGFEPFDNNSLNPSQLVIEALKKMPYPEAELHTCLLPVDMHAMPKVLINRIISLNPDTVISLGQATGRPVISLEKVAINLLDFRIPDNDGNQVKEQPILINGPDAYFCTLPVYYLAESLSSLGIPCEVSYSAGAYLCNQAFYLLMHVSQTNKLPSIAGFIHLPALPEQISTSKKPIPSMTLETGIKAISHIIEILISKSKE